MDWFKSIAQFDDRFDNIFDPNANRPIGAACEKYFRTPWWKFHAEDAVLVRLQHTHVLVWTVNGTLVQAAFVCANEIDRCIGWMHLKHQRLRVPVRQHDRVALRLNPFLCERERERDVYGLPVCLIQTFDGWIVVYGNAFDATFDLLHTHLATGDKMRTVFVRILHDKTILGNR